MLRNISTAGPRLWTGLFLDFKDICGRLVLANKIRSVGGIMGSPNALAIVSLCYILEDLIRTLVETSPASHQSTTR